MEIRIKHFGLKMTVLEENMEGFRGKVQDWQGNQKTKK